jgi:hypothetical protein
MTKAVGVTGFDSSQHSGMLMPNDAKNSDFIANLGIMLQKSRNDQHVRTLTRIFRQIWGSFFWLEEHTLNFNPSPFFGAPAHGVVLENAYSTKDMVGTVFLYTLATPRKPRLTADNCNLSRSS